MLKRSALQYLENWKDKKIRKPLVIRGARQVGKSYLVRMFAKEAGLDLIEINLELSDDYADCFTSKDPNQIITLLELKTSRRITPGKTLLFLDEIQAAPQILASLRYFYEREIKFILAVKLVEAGRISTGRAAEWLGISKPRFLLEMGRYGLSAFPIDEETIKKDIMNVKESIS